MREAEGQQETADERLDALEWALQNTDRIKDRLVRAYVLKLKKLIEQEEKRADAQEMGQGDPAPALILSRASFKEAFLVV